MPGNWQDSDHKPTHSATVKDHQENLSVILSYDIKVIAALGCKKNRNRSVALLKKTIFFEINEKKLHKGLVIL
jgi:hypothetical protein